MSEWIAHSSDTPAVLLGHRMNFRRARLYCLCEYGIRIWHGQD
jgi:hypothetical protein